MRATCIWLCQSTNHWPFTFFCPPQLPPYDTLPTIYLALLDPIPPSTISKKDSQELVRNLIKFSSSSLPLNLDFGRHFSRGIEDNETEEGTGGKNDQDRDDDEDSEAEERIDDQIFDPRVISEDIRARIPIGTQKNSTKTKLNLSCLSALQNTTFSGCFVAGIDESTFHSVF